jgi:hypothetical protein
LNRTRTISPTGSQLFTNETPLSNYKEATGDPQPAWTPGRAHPTFLKDHTIKIATIVGLLHDMITQCWLNKVIELQETEKATLLQTSQPAFFKTAASKETVEGLSKEQSMDEAHLYAVISNKIATESKSVQASLSELENMIRCTTINDVEQNNTRGGAKQECASKKHNPISQPRRCSSISCMRGLQPRSPQKAKEMRAQPMWPPMQPPKEATARTRN